MTVFLLLIIFILLGYLLAFTPLGDRIVSVADEMVGQVRGSDRKEKAAAADASDFREWLLTDPAVPDDLRLWYAGLDNPQALRFEQALQSHGQNTGLQLVSLVTGEIDNKPVLRNIYVEAVSIYSQAYRKAREAIAVEQEENQPAPEAPEREARPEPRVEGKVVAEKRTSRRRATPGQAGAVPAA